MISRRAFNRSFSTIAAAALGTSPTVQAQNLPTRLIVGYPPGGATDTAGRLLARGMQPHYPLGVIVDNKAGASSRIALEFLKSSPPDGATMLLTADFPLTIFPHIYKKLSYDPVKDFTPVALCAQLPYVVCIGPAVPESVRTVAQFVEWCKANPQKAAFASPAAGGTGHFAGLMFGKNAGIELLHVAYKGGAPALADLLGGQIPCSFNALGEALPYAGDKRMRFLGMTGAKRSRFLPDLPTMVELGFKDVVVESWQGILMPAKTPQPVVAAAAVAINGALATPEVRDGFGKAAGMDIFQGNSATFSELIRSDTAKWAPIIKSSGFTAED